MLKEINVFLGCLSIVLKWALKEATFTIDIEDLSTYRESADVIVIAPVNSEVGPELKSNPLEMQRESPPRRSARRVICQRGAERDLENKMRCGASVYDVLSPNGKFADSKRETERLPTSGGSWADGFKSF